MRDGMATLTHRAPAMAGGDRAGSPVTAAHREAAHMFPQRSGGRPCVARCGGNCRRSCVRRWRERRRRCPHWCGRKCTGLCARRWAKRCIAVQRYATRAFSPAASPAERAPQHQAVLGRVVVHRLAPGGFEAQGRVPCHLPRARPRARTSRPRRQARARRRASRPRDRAVRRDRSRPPRRDGARPRTPCPTRGPRCRRATTTAASRSMRTDPLAPHSS